MGELDTDGPVRAIDVSVARRLAVSRQRLAGPREAADAEGIMRVVRDLNCIQLDPISVVARSHRLVLWSRVGAYDERVLDTLMWEERRLFEYWAHAASIVLTEDYPIHWRLMRSYPRGDGPAARRLRAWIDANRGLRRSILTALRRRGPLPSRALADASDIAWSSSGWTNDRNVDRMLDVLWTQNRIMVAGRQGGQKLWDLTERILPAWTPRERLTQQQVTRRAAELSLRSLGVATAAHIRRNFTMDRYPGLDEVLARLERDGHIVRVAVADGRRRLAGDWYVHAADLTLLERLEAGAFEPRTTLLSPFDNLIRDRRRLEELFGFSHRMEIYVPAAKRRYGYYVLPVLRGDRFIGRIDPRMDRERGRLVVRAVHYEPEIAVSRVVSRSVSSAIEDLATFLGATEVEFEPGTAAGGRPRRASVR